MDIEEIDEDEETKWTIWKNIDKKIILKKVTGSMACLMNEIDESWSKFLLDAFINRQQRRYIQHIREQSNPDGFNVIQLDFAEHYRFVRQRELQAAHWNTDQASLFTVHFKIGNTNRPMVFISDYMEHDVKFVWAVQHLIIGFVKEKYPRVRRVHYFR